MLFGMRIEPSKAIRKYPEDAEEQMLVSPEDILAVHKNNVKDYALYSPAPSSQG